MTQRARYVWYAFFIGIALTFIYIQWIPNFKHSSFFQNQTRGIVYQGALLSVPFEEKEGEILVPLKAIQESFDPYAFEEADGSMTLVGVHNEIMHVKDPMISLKTLTSLYSLEITKNPSSNLLYIPDPLASVATVVSKTHLRDNNSIHGKIISTLHPGDTVEVLEQAEKWTRVQSSTGYFGYVQSKKIQLQTSPVETTSTPSPFVTVVWDQGGYPATAALTGITAVSPVWFTLADAQGSIDSSRASLSYVNDAHNRGIKVWALFNNDFKPQMTHDALASFDTRQLMIQRVLRFVEEYQLDGINMDFENVFLKDKAVYAQFVRELAALLHKQEKTISVDVTTKSNDETWSLFLDRKALGTFADYLMLMAYDQTPEASKTAGSVASLPWTEEGIISLLEDVPPAKVILSIPLYTRVWKGDDEVSGATLSYKFTSSWLTNRKLTPTVDSESGQHVVDTTDESGIRVRVWVEDAYSMEKRFNLARKYELGGIAAWSRNHANEETWTTFFEILNKSTGK